MRTFFVVFLVLAGCSGGRSADSDLCVGRRAGDLVITEYLADPAGTDSGKQWFEVFNTLGTDVELAGFTLFNGDKTHLVRTGTVASRGYFTFGDVRTGALPPFIGYSYGGDLGALPHSGAHFGLRCKDVVIDEVNELVAAKPGHARQLDEQSGWCDATAPIDGGNFGTPGAANTGCAAVDAGCLGPPAAGELELSEVMANPRAVSDAVGEWVEVHALAPCDLRGLTLSSGTSASSLRGEGCIHLEAGEYAVLAKSFDAGLPNVRATFSSSLLNSASTISLRVGDAGVASAEVPAALDGVSWQRDPASGSFCAATAAYETGDFGTPGAANSACATSVVGPGCRLPSFGDVAFSEWMPDPSVVADSSGEWIELRAFRPFDLNGLVVSNGSASTVLSSPACLPVAAGELVLLGRSVDSAKNGGLPEVAATFGFDLVNAGGTLSLSLPDGGLLDSVTYPAATRGASFFIDGARCDPQQYAVPPSVCVTPADLTYGSGDRGTPGALNGACP